MSANEIGPVAMDLLGEAMEVLSVLARAVDEEVGEGLIPLSSTVDALVAAERFLSPDALPGLHARRDI